MMAGLSHCLIFMEKPDWNPVALLPAELFFKPPASCRYKEQSLDGEGVSHSGRHGGELVWEEVHPSW